MSRRKAPEISAPLRLPCGQTLPNRLMKSALSEGLADAGGSPGVRLERLYERWQRGGYGLVVTGNVMVDRHHLGEPGNVVVEDGRHLDALLRWSKGFQVGGTPLWMQINHPGRQANSLAGRQRPVAPSAIRAKVPGAMEPRELRGDEIANIIERFAATAQVAEAAGFNGVQIHAAHGYLISQFLSPRANQREDEWGGDPERRRRFLLEIIRAIRECVSPSFAVGIKLNSADFQRGGFTEAESREVIAALPAEGIDLIEISGGSYEAPAMMGQVRESTALREAYFLEYAATVRELAGGVPMAVTGGFRTRAAIELAVTSAACDVVGLGRPSCLLPESAAAVLSSEVEQLPVGQARVGGRAMVGKVANLQTLDSVLDLQWHTDQLQRMGDGCDPDPERSWWRSAGSLVVRNGLGAFRPRRGL